MNFATPPAVKGLMEGIDAASLEYPEEQSPDLENVRVSTLTWATRLGYAAWQSLPGAGAVRLLENLYQSSGARTRLAAQGSGTTAQLYELKEGTDTSFVTASGGGSLGGTSQGMFQGVTQADKFYFTDRSGALRKYQPSNFTPQNVHTVAVTQPAMPTAAPTATPRWYNRLEDWANGWNDSDATKFADSDDTATTPAPDGAKTRKLAVLSTAALGQTITKPTAATNLNSHTIAFWLNQDQFKTQVAFQFGIGSATDFQSMFSSDSQNTKTWYPFFVPIGDLVNLNYLRFYCAAVSPGGSANLWVSQLYLPGRLEGQYRWRYTHYDSTNGRESPPSSPSNGGQPLDFSAVGVSFNTTSGRSAFAKSCALRFTSDSGTDSSTDKMRIYRSGGVASLTVDENGNDLWLRVGEVPDFQTTFSQTDAANSTLLHLTATTNLAIGMYLVLEPGVVGKEEYVQITGVTASTVNVTLGGGTSGTTQYSHANGSAIQIALVDNVANEQIDVTTPIDVRRDDPPAAARFVVRSPEGRLILLNYASHPCGIAWSNKPTPDRQNDYEVFADGVDPLTTRSLTQGWRVDFTGGVAADEEIVWGGFYLGWLTFLTRRALYVVQANSQNEWGPTAIQKLHNTGCIAGDTVQEVNGVLYWVADGPRVMAWTGRGEPENVGDLKVNARLAAAPQSLWGQWFARGHTTQDGYYYKLYFTPSGQTANTQRLDYNIQRQAFEPVVYYDAGGTPIGYQAAVVRAGNVDSPDLYQVDTKGNAVQTERGLLDGTVAIKVRFSTPKIAIRRSHPYWEAFVSTSLVHSLLIRLAGVTDTATVQLQTGGAEYGVTTHSYAINLAGTSDREIKVRADRDLVGRWLQVTISGDFVNRPAFRDLSIFWLPWRIGRISGNT